MCGWIKLHRKIVEWERYKNSNMVHLFMHIVLSANHKDGKRQGIDVKRGQLITGRKSLSKDTGISEQSIRTCLKNLEKSQNLTIKSTKLYSIITVVKYNDYNEQEIKSTIKSTNDQPSTNQALTTNNNNKNVTIDNIEDSKKLFGDYVSLTNNEYKRLVNEFTEQIILDKIQAMENWIVNKNKGKGYKDYNKAIRDWIRKDIKKQTKIFTNDFDAYCYYKDNNNKIELDKLKKKVGDEVSKTMYADYIINRMNF